MTITGRLRAAFEGESRARKERAARLRAHKLLGLAAYHEAFGRAFEQAAQRLGEGLTIGELGLEVQRWIDAEPPTDYDPSLSPRERRARVGYFSGLTAVQTDLISTERHGVPPSCREQYPGLEFSELPIWDSPPILTPRYISEEYRDEDGRTRSRPAKRDEF